MADRIHYHIYEEVDSTSNRVKQMAMEGCPAYTVVSAECQSAGRGRRGKAWDSPPRTSVYTSMAFYPKLPANAVSSLTLLAALAVRSVLAARYELRPLIKWPNDLVLNGKKVCGILAEHCFRDDGSSFVAIGIGVNLCRQRFPEELADRATSIAQALEEQCENDGLRASWTADFDSERQILTKALWEEFCRYYDVFRQTEDLSLLKEEYEQFLANRNRPVRVEDPLGSYQGTAIGIDLSGALLVETEQGRRRVDSGEVSVRGIYGYV